MNTLVNDAIEALYRMPKDMQEAAARVILEFGAGQDDDVS